MKTIAERIEICQILRRVTAEAVQQTLARAIQVSEVQYRDMLAVALKTPQVHAAGWYDPPAGGVAVLFASDDYTRLQFDTLRKPEFWPREDHVLTPNGTALVYASPVHRETGIIGDFGGTFYLGRDEAVRRHIDDCLRVMQKALGLVRVGMKFRELHEQAQVLFADAGLTNERTVTQTDQTGTNLGHTVPWTYEDPVPGEQAVIEGSDFGALRNLISTKRIYVNGREEFEIPSNGIFTFESRLESVYDRALPNVFSHFMVGFKDGEQLTFSI